jgi:hypothetical protein
MIQKYQKKPVTIEAIQFKEESIPTIKDWLGENLLAEARYSSPIHWIYRIKTLEGNMLVTEGDFIIKGVKDEFYPCKPDIFEATYEKTVEELLNEYNKPETRERLTELRDQELVLMTKPVQENPLIVFSAKQEEVIRISQGKFYFKGEEVEDKYQVYERFNEWMTMAEEPISKPTLKDLKFNETKIDNINW